MDGFELNLAWAEHLAESVPWMEKSEGMLSPTVRLYPPLPHLISAPIGQAIHRLLLIQAFRPDRLLAMAHMFVSTNLGESFMSIMEQPLDLTHIVGTEVMSPCPILAPVDTTCLYTSGWPHSPGTRFLAQSSQSQHHPQAFS